MLVTQYQGRRALRHRLCGIAAALLLSACATPTPLSPTQRQQLETRAYSASYERTFAAARDAFVNASYVIDDSDYEGGIMHVSARVLGKNPNVALGWSILAPFGDGYNGRWGWAVFDTLLWPLSIVWAAPVNYMIAKGSWQDLEGNLSFEELSSERTRLRVSLRGVPHDAESYPRLIRGFHEEIERQLFVKGGDTLGGEPQ